MSNGLEKACPDLPAIFVRHIAHLDRIGITLEQLADQRSLIEALYRETMHAVQERHRHQATRATRDEAVRELMVLGAIFEAVHETLAEYAPREIEALRSALPDLGESREGELSQAAQQRLRAVVLAPALIEEEALSELEFTIANVLARLLSIGHLERRFFEGQCFLLLAQRRARDALAELCERLITSLPHSASVQAAAQRHARLLTTQLLERTALMEGALPRTAGRGGPPAGTTN